MKFRQVYRVLATLCFAIQLPGSGLVQGQTPEPIGLAQALPLTTMRVLSAHGKPHLFAVQLAKTPEQQEIGLMWRQSMTDKEGMYFPFETVRAAAFWMKNCFMPIDMLFIKQDGRIANIITAPPMTLEPRQSLGPVAAVLELAGGAAAKLGIKAGDRVLAPDDHKHR